MATYAQWARTRPVRRLTYVCGTERVLAEEVVALAVAAADDYVPLIAGDDPEEAVWDAASQLPPDPDVVRLVLVRSAQRLRNWDQFPAIAGARAELGNVRLFFCSDEDDFAYVREDEERQLAPHLALIRDSRQGLLVRCGTPSSEALLDWASEQLGGAGKVLADHLLTRTGSDLRAVADVAGKLVLSGITPTRERIDLLAEQAPGATFADSLMLERKPAALLALDQLTEGEAGGVIALLDSRVSTLAVLHDAYVRRMDARDIAVKLGVGQFLQRAFREVAPAWTPARVTDHRSLLAVADDAWRSGAGEGILEMVCALW